MKMLTLGAAALVTVLGPLAGGARAQVDTVDWAGDGSLDGTGTGTLAGGAITVTYTTVVGVGNAGTNIGDNWDVSLATDGVGLGPVTHQTGGVFGVVGIGAQSSIITFSSAVTNPILYVNFTDEPTTMDFGALSLTLLDSNNAQLVGSSLVTFIGSLNGFNDGFAARINGTFGPGTPITFSYIDTLARFDSVGFTVSAAPAAAVPEPSSAALLVPGGLGLLGRMLRRRVPGRKA